MCTFTWQYKSWYIFLKIGFVRSIRIPEWIKFLQTLHYHSISDAASIHLVLKWVHLHGTISVSDGFSWKPPHANILIPEWFWFLHRLHYQFIISDTNSIHLVLTWLPLYAIINTADWFSRKPALWEIFSFSGDFNFSLSSLLLSMSSLSILITILWILYLIVCYLHSIEFF